MTKNILFLDFDGVMNNSGWYESEHRVLQRNMIEWVDGKPRRLIEDIDPKNMAHLAEIAKRVPTLRCVVSSTWRFGRTLADLQKILLPAFSPDRVVGVTGASPTRLRYIEIQDWLRDHGTEVVRFLALDDDTFDMTPLGENFLHVHRSLGLTAEHVEKAVAHFAEKPRLPEAP